MSGCECTIPACVCVNVLAGLHGQIHPRALWWAVNYSPAALGLLFMSDKKSFITTIAESHTHTRTHTQCTCAICFALPTAANLSSPQSSVSSFHISRFSFPSSFHSLFFLIKSLISPHLQCRCTIHSKPILKSFERLWASQVFCHETIFNLCRFETTRKQSLWNAGTDKSKVSVVR